MSHILIIDDDRDFSRSLQIQLEMEDHQTDIANTGTTGIQKAVESRPDLILLDLKLRETDGLDVMDRLRANGVEAPVVMITGEQDMQANIKAVRKGVLEYLRKPFPLKAILNIVADLGERSPSNEKPNGVLPVRQVSENPREIIGADPAILDVIKQIGLLSRSRVSVLVQGESGTGKEVVGRALHDNTCSEQPFVAINCTAVVPTLLESELFGHVKGAFTGATEDKEGKLAMAKQGTLFLDEIGDMPLDLQPKLLRVIQEREFTPVGGGKAQPFEARIIAVTHRNLEQMVAEGDFREDLYYRLAVAELHVPPLRHRKGDIELLTQHLLWRICRNLHRSIGGISRDAVEKLKSYDWPGNVRELENVLTRAVALSDRDVLQEYELNVSQAVGYLRPPEKEDEVLTLETLEKRHVLAALDACNWNITHASERLGISRPTLRKKIKDYGLQAPDDA